MKPLQARAGSTKSSTTATEWIDGRDIKLLTRTGLDWSHRYRRTIEALRGLDENSTELLFNLMQLPSGDKNQRPSYERAVVWLCRPRAQVWLTTSQCAAGKVYGRHPLLRVWCVQRH